MPKKRPFERYIPFTSDYGFNITFGNEHNTLFLRRSLQAIIELENPIESVVFEKNTKPAATMKGRHSVYDLTCRLDNGEIVIVEMQLGAYPQMVKRLEYYAVTRMVPFVKKGKWKFDGIPRIYTIAIMAKSLFPDLDYHRIACLYDKKHRLVDDSLQFIFIELDKFRKSAELCETDLDKLIYTMKALPKIKEEAEMADFMQDEWLASAIKELDGGNLTPDERANLEIAVAREMSSRYYEEQWGAFMMKQGLERGITKGHKIGIREGRKVGREQGRQEGLQEGRQEGRQEGINLTIKTLLIKHPDWTPIYISELLDIPLELVNKIKNELAGDQ